MDADNVVGMPICWLSALFLFVILKYNWSRVPSLALGAGRLKDV